MSGKSSKKQNLKVIIDNIYAFALLNQISISESQLCDLIFCLNVKKFHATSPGELNRTREY